MTTQGRIAPYDDATYDPFEAFDRTAGAAKVANPYPDFADLRREGPVHKRDLRELYDLEGMDGLGDLPDAYTVVTHEAVEKVLRDGLTFSSSGYAESMGMVMGHSILEMDEPEHSTYRGALNPYLSPAAIKRWQPFVDEIVRAALDEKIESGSIDFVDDLANIVPAVLTLAMMGVELSKWPVYSEPAHMSVSTPEHSPDAPRVAEMNRQMGIDMINTMMEMKENPRPGLID